MAFRKALGINAAQQAATFWLGFASVVIVSRLLRPEEIGVFSVAVSVIGFAHILREFGVLQYLVQASEVGRSQLRAALTVTLASSWLIALGIFLLRWPLSRFYGHQGIADVLLLISLNFVVLPLGSVQMAMLKRELRFSTVAAITVVSTLVQTAVTIACAYLGQSYLSMAWGSLAMYLSNAALVNWVRRDHAAIWPTVHGLGDVLRFGSLSSTTSLVREVGQAAPDLILGRTLGFAEVALFSRGQGLQSMLVQRIDTLVRQVHFPTLSSELRKGGDAAQLFLHAASHLSGVTVPLLAVLAVLSEPLILFVFGEQWRAAVEVAIYICIGRLLVAPYTLVSVTLLAAGKLQSELQAESLILVARLVALFSSIWLPLSAVLQLLVLSYAVEAFATQRALRRGFGVHGAEMWRANWKAVALVPFATTGPALVLLAAHLSGQGAVLYLPVLVVGGGLALGGWLLGLHWLEHPMRHEVGRLLAHARSMIKRS